MTNHADVVLDAAKVEEDAERAREAVSSGSAWLVRRWTVTFALMLAVFLVIDVFAREAAPDLPWSLRSVLIALGMAAAVATAGVWMEWRMLPRSVEALERSIRTQWSQVTGAGWPLRILIMSLLGALAIGVPVGALLAWGAPVEALPTGSRAVEVMAFVGMTIVWVVPAGFLIRYWSVRRLRTYVLGAASRPATPE